MTRIRRAATIIWAALCVALLGLTLSIYDGTSATRDAEVLLLYGMMALAFPGSLLAALLLWVLATLVGTTSIPVTYVTLVLEWSVLFGIGYLQWFVLLPWIWRRWKER